MKSKRIEYGVFIGARNENSFFFPEFDYIKLKSIELDIFVLTFGNNHTNFPVSIAKFIVIELLTFFSSRSFVRSFVLSIMFTFDEKKKIKISFHSKWFSSNCHSFTIVEEQGNVGAIAMRPCGTKASVDRTAGKKIFVQHL